MNLRVLIPKSSFWLPISILIIIIWITNGMETGSKIDTNSDTLLLRKKRFLAFPEGSSVAIALCMTMGYVPTYLLPGYPYSLISIATNWGLVYNLPNASWIIHQIGKQSLKPKHKQIILRRNRRELYNNIEIIIDHMGYNGKECILRALCESAQFFAKRPKITMLEKILRTMLSLPKTRLFSFESSDFYDYDEAYRYGHKINDCSSVYNDCQFSLLDLAFGKYSESQTNIPQPQFSTSHDPFNNPSKFN